jgi:hypothetical protein|tara:strand:- start:46611 stop:47105 length:495 start_codon:yes stop_codon:yes gene_type:complete
MTKVSLAAQIMEVDYELDMRRGVYPRRVNAGKMKQAEADLHVGQLSAVRGSLVFLQANEATIRAAIKAANDPDRSGDDAIVAVLERSLAEHRGNLSEIIESCSELDQADGDWVPRAGSLHHEAASAVTRLIALVRDLEAIAGRPVEHPEPQWLDDLLDGKWSAS